MTPDPHRMSNTAIIGLIMGGGLALLGGLLGATAIMNAAAIPVWGAVCVFGWLTSRGPVGQALADRLRGGPVTPELTVPEEVYAELDDLRTRMLEMEARQDFSERVLTQRSTATDDRLGGENGGQ